VADPAIVHRDHFAQAVVRISSYFNPSEPIVLRQNTLGPPYTVEEALGHFRTVLCLLADRLEEISSPNIMSSGDGSPRFQGAVPDSQRTAADSPGCFRSRSHGEGQGALGDAMRQSSSQLQRVRVGSSSPQRLLSMGLGDDGSQPDAVSEELEQRLAASRSRAADLRRALGREEELLWKQSEETQRLERLQLDLELEVQAKSQRRVQAFVDQERKQEDAPSAFAAHDGSSVWKRASSDKPGPPETDASLAGPMSLNDVKRHLRTVQQLRHRVLQLEGELDGREEQAGALTAELEMRREQLAARTSLPGGNAQQREWPPPITGVAVAKDPSWPGPFP
jgi:hypothetical protein